MFKRSVVTNSKETVFVDTLHLVLTSRPVPRHFSGGIESSNLISTWRPCVHWVAYPAGANRSFRGSSVPSYGPTVVCHLILHVDNMYGHKNGFMDIKMKPQAVEKYILVWLFYSVHFMQITMRFSLEFETQIDQNL